MGSCKPWKITLKLNQADPSHQKAISMKPIRASEVGSYIYCARAWMYARQGIEPSNQAEMTTGSELHRLHGRQVFASRLTRALALILLLDRPRPARRLLHPANPLMSLRGA